MENPHIAGRFDKDLGKIQTRVSVMGALVSTQLQSAMLAVMDRQAIDIDALIKRDRKVNGMNKAIADRAERLIALRQPMAVDLRQALSLINIASELERIGDHAKSTAKRAKKIKSGTIPAIFQDVLSEMNAMVITQLADVLQAYENNDLELALRIRRRDLDVDDLNKRLFDLSLETLSNAQGNAETLMNVVLISRSLERVGDYIVNIARSINHIATGDNLKATE